VFVPVWKKWSDKMEWWKGKTSTQTVHYCRHTSCCSRICFFWSSFNDSAPVIRRANTSVFICERGVRFTRISATDTNHFNQTRLRVNIQNKHLLSLLRISGNYLMTSTVSQTLDSSSGIWRSFRSKQPSTIVDILKKTAISAVLLYFLLHCTADQLQQ